MKFRLFLLSVLLYNIANASAPAQAATAAPSDPQKGILIKDPRAGADIESSSKYATQATKNASSNAPLLLSYTLGSVLKAAELENIARLDPNHIVTAQAASAAPAAPAKNTHSDE